MNNKQLYIGLMSGTSADGIDLALIDFATQKPIHVASYYQPYDDALRAEITALYSPGHNEIDRAFSLDKALAKLFSQAIHAFLTEQKLHSKDIIAIGNHGQTIRHRPSLQDKFTLQIGCSQTLATLCNIKVIGQFRLKDMAVNGQGAPLVPAFHQALFASKQTDVCVVNIGGIANVTFLPADEHKTILGFDTGPGNALLDDWFKHHHNAQFDQGGQWASQGVVNQTLLDELLTYRYFSLAPPKSTGREEFNLQWLKPFIQINDIPPCDVQATLSQLTANTICQHIVAFCPQGDVYLCGGGVHNAQLTTQIKQLLPRHNVLTTSDKGIDNDALEAMAFAWLAYAYEHDITGNIPAVTGADKAVVLGCAFYP